MSSKWFAILLPALIQLLTTFAQQQAEKTGTPR